jgi:endonuclease I
MTRVVPAAAGQPAVVDANQDRSNYRPAIIGPDSADRWKRFCAFEVSRCDPLVEPRLAMRSMIARTALYMVALPYCQTACTP